MKHSESDGFLRRLKDDNWDRMISRSVTARVRRNETRRIVSLSAAAVFFGVIVSAYILGTGTDFLPPFSTLAVEELLMPSVFEHDIGSVLSIAFL